MSAVVSNIESIHVTGTRRPFGCLAQSLVFEVRRAALAERDDLYLVPLHDDFVLELMRDDLEASMIELAWIPKEILPYFKRQSTQSSRC